MLENKTYGISCSGCKRTLRVGRVRLEEGAQLDDLRRELAVRNWKSHMVICPRETCKSATPALLNDLVFMDDPSRVRVWRGFLRRLGLAQR